MEANGGGAIGSRSLLRGPAAVELPPPLCGRVARVTILASAGTQPFADWFARHALAWGVSVAVARTCASPTAGADLGDVIAFDIADGENLLASGAALVVSFRPERSEVDDASHGGGDNGGGDYFATTSSITLAAESDFAKLITLARRWLGVAEHAPRLAVLDGGFHRLVALVGANEVLADAFDEMAGDRAPTGAAVRLADRPVSSIELAEFALGAAHHTWNGDQLETVVRALAKLIDRRHVGHAAMEFVLSAPGASEHVQAEAMLALIDETTDDTVAWALDTLQRHCSQRPAHFSRLLHTMLKRRAYSIEAVRRAALDATLLDQRLGPIGHVPDCFEQIILSFADPERYVDRLLDWIASGQFDHRCRRSAADSGAEILYRILNDRWANPRFAAVGRALEFRVRQLLASNDPIDWSNGLHHLYEMVVVRYRGASRVLLANPSLTHPRTEVLSRLSSALRSVAAFAAGAADAVAVEAAQRKIESLHPRGRVDFLSP